MTKEPLIESEVEQRLTNAKRNRQLIERRIGRLTDQLRDLRAARSLREERRFVQAARETLDREVWDAIWAKAREAL